MQSTKHKSHMYIIQNDWLTHVVMFLQTFCHLVACEICSVGAKLQKSIFTGATEVIFCHLATALKLPKCTLWGFGMDTQD